MPVPLVLRHNCTPVDDYAAFACGYDWRRDPINVRKSPYLPSVDFTGVEQADVSSTPFGIESGRPPRE